MNSLIKQQIVGTQVSNGLANASDAFDYIYECISGNHGNDIREYVDAIYQCVSIDHRLHPDDDFEQIINYVLDDLEA